MGHNSKESSAYGTQRLITQICDCDKYDKSSSKLIQVIKLSFCQNDPLLRESFWQNNSLVTHILFELKPIIIFSPVANFGDQSQV